MKKFVIVSTILLLIGAGAFGYSLYHYLQTTNPAPATATPTQAMSAASDATEEPQLSRSELEDNGIFSQYYAAAAEKVAGMTKEQMIGQMLIGSFTDTATAVTDVKRFSLAGALFKNESLDYMSQDEVKTALANVAASGDIAPMLAAEEEGGRVTTVSGHDAFSDYTFESPRDIYEAGGIAEVEKVEDTKMQLLKSLGFGVNLAPVVDMPDTFDQIMYSRSISSDVQVTSTFAEYAAKFNQAKGVSVCLKHFPGYGTIPDTYEPVVVDTREAAVIRSKDYAPFKAGIDAGAHFVMISNVVVQSIDPTHTAALSSVFHRELREDLGFTGLIITDQLDASDYSAYSDGRDVAVSAVLAGNDLILVSDYSTAYNSILAALNEGVIDPAIIQQACTRVLAYKYSVGLLS